MGTGKVLICKQCGTSWMHLIGVGMKSSLEELEQELASAMYILPDLTQEDLMLIGNMKNECTYMNRTNIISDKRIDEIIKEFNGKFGTNGNEEFNDGEETLGFKDFDEMRGGNSDGYATDMETSKLDIEKDVTIPEDEEEFEEIADTDEGL